MNDTDLPYTLQSGIIAALSLPIPTSSSTSWTNQLINSFQSKHITIKKQVQGAEIVVKSYNHQEVHVSRSEGPYKTLLFDILSELQTGTLERVPDTYIYPQVSSQSKEYTFMSSKHKIWIHRVKRYEFKRIVSQYKTFMNYYRKQKYSLLPNILGLMRFSEVLNPQGKVYFMVFQSPFPFRTHHRLKYFLFSDNQRVMYWDQKIDIESPPCSVRFHVPFSHETQPYKTIDSNFWLDVDDRFKEAIWDYVVEDLKILGAMGMTKYSFIVIGAERDNVIGNLFLPGQVFGRANEEKRTSIEKQDTVKARHDIFLDAEKCKIVGNHSIGSSLLPISIAKDDISLL